MYLGVSQHGSKVFQMEIIMKHQQWVDAWNHRFSKCDTSTIRGIWAPSCGIQQKNGLSTVQLYLTYKSVHLHLIFQMKCKCWLFQYTLFLFCFLFKDNVAVQTMRDELQWSLITYQAWIYAYDDYAAVF